MFTQQYRPTTSPAGHGTYPTAHVGGGYSGYPQPTGGAMPPQVPVGSPITPGGTVMPAPVNYEQSYIENIFRLNLGKVGTFYMTYENNSEWNAKVFRGVLEAAGRDHIIISDPTTGVRTVMLMVNFDYATFDEPLLYQYPGVIGSPPPTRR
ncbi:spore coat protein GerQ [Paenibacillus phocaensis]|uniref:spore coat protein GerQ n=1 Tax=Paenibacillus phocaensis TaxID=1776378 RepID=UPI000839BC77|nr:spore coat protein GerQ [Paenibacillus phocaensis]